MTLTGLLRGEARVGVLGAGVGRGRAKAGQESRAVQRREVKSKS